MPNRNKWPEISTASACSGKCGAIGHLVRSDLYLRALGGEILQREHIKNEYLYLHKIKNGNTVPCV